MCQFRFDIWIFETMRIIPNVAARLPGDVSKCGAQLSADVEMATLFGLVTCIIIVTKAVVSEWIATASAIAVREVAREGERGFCGHVTCIMIVTGVRFLYAT
jgi:hypothetical protein